MAKGTFAGRTFRPKSFASGTWDGGGIIILPSPFLIFLTGNVQRNVAETEAIQRNVRVSGNAQRNLGLTGDAGADAI